MKLCTSLTVLFIAFFLNALPGSAQEDLRISVSATHVNANPGDEITYIIKYSNAGLTASSNVVITDQLPASGFTYVSSTPAGTISGNIITWTSTQIAGLTSLGGGQYQIIVKIKAGIPGDGSTGSINGYYLPTSPFSLVNYATIKSNVTPTPVSSEPVATNVTQISSIYMNDATTIVKSAPNTVYCMMQITNNGNIYDKFTFSSTNSQCGTEGFVPLESDFNDLDGNVISNSGWLSPGQTYIFLFKVITPNGTPANRWSCFEVKSTSVVSGISGVGHASTQVLGSPHEPLVCISKIDAKNPVNAGDYITYTIYAINSNQGYPAKNFVITENYPSNIIFINATPAPDTGFNNKWSLGDLEYGLAGSKTITITAQVNPLNNCNGNIINTITSAYTDAKTFPAATLATTIKSYPDLEITKTAVASTVPAQKGGSITYTLNYQNSGTCDAANAVITDAFDDYHVNIINAGGGIPAGSNMSWNLGLLTPGQSGSITYTVLIDPAVNYIPGTFHILNSASISTTTVESNYNNNSASASIPVSMLPDLKIEILSVNPEISAGTSSTYTLKISNVGDIAAKDVVIKDLLPANLTGKTVSHGGTITDGTITWPTISTFEVGSSVEYTVEVTASCTAIPSVTDSVTVISSFIDKDDSNNTATLTSIVADSTPPVPPVLPNVIVGECSGIPVAPTANDNCSGVITGTTSTVFPITQQGTTVVSWTFDDGNGNVITADQNVLVDDVTSPVADITDLPDALDECSVTVTAPTATDNCKGKIIGTTTDPLTYSEQGIYTIHWTFDDGNGNTSSQTQSVVVDDITSPVKPVLSDVTVGECSGIPVAPTTTDNCKGIITGTTSTIFPITQQGTTVVSWTFDDGNGNVTTAHQNVLVDDVTSPVADITDLPVINGECNAAAIAPTATDNCKGKITATTPDPLTYSEQGIYTIHWIYDDGNGNTSSQNQTVVVDDTTSPVKPVLADITVGECSGTPIAATTIDNCKGIITGTTSTIFPITQQGTTIVTWTFDDGNGNVTTADQNVLVDDVTSPVADITDLPVINGECNAAAIAPTATDNCKGKITATTPDPLTYSEQGIYTIHWTFDDGNGNTSSQTQNMIVDDITSPVKPVLSDVTVGECSGTPIAPTTTDNCKGIITGTTSTIFPITQQGTTVVSWTFDDGNGNVTTADQNVLVDDVTLPVPDIASLPDALGECSVTVTAPSATDNCKGKIIGTTTDPLTYFEQGIYIIHWIYDDGNGNTSIQTQSVVVDDITSPVADITDLSVINGECNAAAIAPTATDNCKGKITATTIDPLTYSEQGIYTIHWIYDDSNGNTSSQNQTVVVDDVTPPETPILADLTVGECSGTPIAPTTTDNCSGLITGTTSTVFPITTQGTTVVSWTFDDGNGNVTTADQNVLVDDVTLPVPDIASLPDALGERSVTVTAPTATDNCKGKIIGTTTDPLTYSEQGIYTIHWIYDDGNGNTSTQTQIVVVNDITPPETPILADVTVGECSGTPIAPTTTDNCKGIITGTTSTVFPITTQGTTIVTWTFDDGNGNVTTASQNVIVDDITSPVPDIAVLPEIIAECSATVTAPTATDNCKGKITATTTDPLTYSEQGSYTIHWTYDDGNGNTSSQTQSVVVDDITAPVADVTDLPNAVGECSVTVTAPTATDNCKGKITATTTDPLIYSEQGSYTIHWTYDDGNGNTSSQTQSVVVDDVTPPETPVLADIIIGECSGTPIAPTTTDNCKGIITGTTTTVFPITTQGTTVVVWTFDDDNGNVTTAYQNVIVDDVTSPVPDIAVLPEIIAECGATAISPTAIDNCKGKITATTTDPLSYSEQGSYTIHWTYDDGNGNTSTQTQSVVVDDVTSPVADVTSLPNAVGECSVTVTAPTATDNCKGSITATTTDPLTYSEQGSYTIHWTYDDGNGNTFTQTQGVVVDDVTPPETPVLADVTVGECSGTSIAPTTTDNCSGLITGTTSTVFPIKTQGTTIVTWTFDDGNGNITTAYQNVIVDDVTSPVPDISSLPDVVGECSVTVTAPTATDNCKGKITATTTDPLTYSEQGSYTIHWTYDDGNGNTSSQTQSVVVDDVTPPETPILADVFLGECSGTPPIPTTVDNCAGIVKGTTSILFPKTKQGKHTIIWTFDDGNGNVTTAYQNLILDDVTSPVPDIAVLPEITAECSATVTAPTATDNCKGKITATTTDPLTYSAQGSYTIHWTYDDGNGNTSTQTQTVIINDVTPPKITGTIAPKTVEGCSVEEVSPAVNTVAALETMGLFINDGCTEDALLAVTSKDVLNGELPFTVTRTYTIRDAGNNSTDYVQTIVVADTQKPTIVCPSDLNITADAGKCNVTNLLLGVPIANDNCSISSISNDAPSIFGLGTTVITWTVLDKSGNSATCQQNVTVDGLPVAVDDKIDVDENSPITGNVMTNDLGLCDNSVQMNIVSEPQFGSLTATSNGDFEYIPHDKYSGTDRFTYQICDKDGDCSTATVEITVNGVNDLPLSVADTEHLQVDVTLNGNVAVNDILSRDGDNLWALISQPSNGTINFNQDGTYTYTPHSEFIGNDNFSYELCDANGDCSKAMVTIIVEDVLIPNQILTPNADDHNDTFIIKGIEYYPVNKVTIYNRWGNIVYKKNNYQNEWDGYSNVSRVGTKSLPLGTYFYLIDYANNRHKTGFIYLDK